MKALFIQASARRFAPMLTLLAGLFWLAGCQKEEIAAPPVVTQVRLLNPASKDSTFTSALPGTLIVIQGQHLDRTLNVFFNDFPAPFNPVYNTAENLIISIPANTPTAVTAPKVSNKLRVVTVRGETTFDFTIVQAPPVIARISNENANPGETITLSGANFFGVSKVVFPGNLSVDSTSFKVNKEGTLLTVEVPKNLTQSGPLSMVATFGTASTPAPINYSSGAGVLCNFDDQNTFQFWSIKMQDDAKLFPGARGNYGYFSVKGIVGGNGEWWTDGRSLNTNPSVWVAPANLKDQVSDYALKFEIFVKSPWKTGTLQIMPSRTPMATSYVYNYRPWQVGTASVDFATPGWQTVTIPLTDFKSNNGSVDSAPTLTALLGDTGSNAILMRLVADTDGMGDVSMAVDNIRVVSNKTK
jgi:hypothetical protein